MCGILFSIQGQRTDSQEAYTRTWATLQELNSRRGPSAQDVHTVSLAQDEISNRAGLMTFYGAVLHLRGDFVTRQPHVSETGNVLLWNGEVFDGIFVDHHQNDGQVLMDQLDSLSLDKDIKDHTSAFLGIMAKIEGPYAFVYYHQLPFGRVNSTIPNEDQLPEPFSESLKFDQAHPEAVPPVTEDMKRAISDMVETLGDSVRRRVQDIPRTGMTHDARVGILFSGGLDCLCLAALADRFLPEGEAIDLLNVGFENPRSEKARAAEEALALKRLKKQGLSNGNDHTGGNSKPKAPSTKYNVPDRITGYESLSELRRIAPRRHWNFVEVNIPFEEATAKRPEILERIAPLETVMDLSIAMAFWFAARGVGYIKNELDEMVPYTSQAKVLLSGLGADEQLGGYSRHKEQFKTASWEGLIQELQLDLDRISTRNLGRDDRIISDHGKEARYPFLCTNVVQFLSNLRVDLKVDLRYPRGVGEKILLRHVARELGFDRASSHWKRAVQFGARTAKMTENGRSEIGQQVVGREGQ
ncbi:hypothetical protein BGZ51_007944 [Haplosporangium sp. Z 767]|nr:hypothetical protein BGZ51_007944 [Haplosporangium sp. Z 767]KAF9195653.1 hypothetical protein BGZ50_004051 [Haplosporangium sp. Z 11]